MNSETVGHDELVSTAATSVNDGIGNLHKELIGIIKDLVAAVPEAGHVATVREAIDSNRSWLETIDALHALVPFIPTDCREECKSQLSAAKGLHDLAHGYISSLALLKSSDQVVRFVVSDRDTERTVPVVLPLLSYIAISDDLGKALRAFMRIRKKILRRASIRNK